jgi:hypothetical protein
MSTKSHPEEGTKHSSSKGSSASYVSHSLHDALGISILKHLHKLWLIVQR